jgi:hypothetical protein
VTNPELFPPVNRGAPLTEFEKYYGSLPQSGQVRTDEERMFDEWLHEDKSQQEKENQTMIELQRNNIPESGGVQKRGVQFLKPAHIKSDKGQLARITKVTTDKPDNFGNPVVVYFLMDVQRYSKGFKLTSDNLASICDILGTDETKWVNRLILIGKFSDDDGNERLIFTKAPATAK